MKNWNDLVFSDELSFEEKAEHVFSFQYEHNPVYRRFCEALDFDRPPLLPVPAFKETEVICGGVENPDTVFRSSGTGDKSRSRHLVADVDIYRRSILNGFRQFYNLDKSVFWVYLPGYSSNPDSSLVWMANELINRDNSGLSRFLPFDKPLNEEEIREVEQTGHILVLFGAAFGLLDLLEINRVKLPSNSLIIETGGMKTHRREMSRNHLHKTLAEGFQLDRSRIHSEYGMAEMLSQAYATGGEWFRCVPWLNVSIRDPDNPQREVDHHTEGLIGFTDLANVYTCSFLLTGDRGIMDNNGRFKVLGRWNPADMRGCNFLIEED